MKFRDIAGHEDTIQVLRNLVDTGKMPHAIMISGIPGIGKYRVARALAQYVHCHNREDGCACGKCPSCLQHQSHNNPDTHFIFPIVKKEGALISQDLYDKWHEMMDKYSYMPWEKWTEIISAGNSQPMIFVNESENIISRASLSAYQEEFKIFIIWLPEKLRPEASNKLLKIIEEPFEDTFFILVSNEPEKVLPTISSRTQRFNLKPISTREISDYLKINKGISESLAYSVAQVADGSIARAIELIDNPKEITEFTNLFKEIMRNAYAVKAKKLKELSELAAGFGREKLLRFLDYMNRMIRENFMYNLKIPNINHLTSAEEEFSSRFSPFIHSGNVEALSKEIAIAARDIERNANSKIVMFDLFLIIAQWVRMAKPN